MSVSTLADLLLNADWCINVKPQTLPPWRQPMHALSEHRCKSVYTLMQRCSHPLAVRCACEEAWIQRPSQPSQQPSQRPIQRPSQRPSQRPNPCFPNQHAYPTVRAGPTTRRDHPIVSVPNQNPNQHPFPHSASMTIGLVTSPLSYQGLGLRVKSTAEARRRSTGDMHASALCSLQDSALQRLLTAVAPVFQHVNQHSVQTKAFISVSVPQSV